MRKALIVLLAAILPVLWFFPGCGKPRELSRKQLTIATGSRSGLYFPVGEAIARILTESFQNLQIQVIETDGSRQNISLLAEGKANLALVQNDMVHYAVYGENMYAQQKIDSITGLATLFPEIVQIIGRKADNFGALEGLRGKKIAVGPENSGTFYNAQQLLTRAKLWDDIQPVLMTPSQALAGLENKTIDAFLYTSGLPNSHIAELATRLPIDALPLSNEITQEMVNAFPFYFPSEIPANTYVGLASPTPALEINALLVSGNSLTDDDLYLISHALFGSLETLQKAHPSLAHLTKTSLRRQLSIPLAEGARRALAEL